MAKQRPASDRYAAALVPAFAGALVAYGNVAAYASGSAVAPGLAGLAFGGALTALTVAGALVLRMPLRELGLSAQRLGTGALAGGAVALVAASGALLVLRFPPLVGGPVTYAPLASLTPSDLGMRIALAMPLDTVIPEEVAFRGLLLAVLLRRYRVPAAVVLSAAVFTAWHAVVLVGTVSQTSLAGDPLFGALALAGATLSIFAGGVLFAVLRVATGSLAAPLVAHWGFNSALLAGLAAQ